MKKEYIQPEMDVTWLKMEAMLCVSGNGEDMKIDDPVDPWAAAVSMFDSTLIF